MHMHCKKCLTGRSDDVLGAPCRTAGCGGVIEEVPPFNTLVDEIPEAMRCPRREESPLTSSRFPGADHWQKFKSNGNRVCSYCGSLHPDDMFDLVPIGSGNQSSMRPQAENEQQEIIVKALSKEEADAAWPLIAEALCRSSEPLPAPKNPSPLAESHESHKRFELMLYGKTGRVKSPKEAS